MARRQLSYRNEGSTTLGSARTRIAGQGLVSALVAGVAFLCYHATLLPGLDFGDSASFQTGVSSLTLTPRQAYPLYYGLGHLFVLFHPGEPATFSAPLFIRDGERLKARLSLHQIRGGYALKGGAMDNQTTAALEAIKEVFADERLQFQFHLKAGEIQYVANREIGHSRTEFRDYEEADRRRLLIRLWLRNEGAQGYIG